MAITHRLRDRLVWATFGVTVVVTAMFFVGAWLAVQAADDRFDAHLESDINSIIARYAKTPNAADLSRDDLAVYVAPSGDRTSLPSYLRDLPRALDQVVVNDIEYDVIVRERGGQTFYFMLDEREQENYERQVLAVALVTLALVLGVSYWLCTAFIHAIVTPVTRLTHQIMELEKTGSGRLQIDEGRPQDEIYYLSKSVNFFNERIQNLLQRERDFSSDVAHELRTPLMGIQGAAENLPRIAALGGDTTELVDRIKRCCTQMTTMIEAFLHLARDGANLSEHLTAVNVDEVVAEQLALLRAIAIKRGILVQVHRSEVPTVKAIPSVVSIVVGNLLKNALTYTNKKTIDVYLTAASMVVQDYGPGIDTALQSAMFERFVRGTHSDPRGAGIGLALVKRFCEIFRWTIDVTSNHVTGTRITLNFQIHLA